MNYFSQFNFELIGKDDLSVSFAAKLFLFMNCKFRKLYLQQTSSEHNRRWIWLQENVKGFAFPGFIFY